MQLFAFNRKVLGDDESTETPIVSTHKDATKQRPERSYTTQLKNQAKMMKKSALNLLGQRSLVTEADSRISNLKKTYKSPRNKAIDMRESSSQCRAAELSVLYELNDNDEHSTLNPIAIIPTKNAGPSLCSKISQLKVKHTDTSTTMPQESNENPSDLIPRKSLQHGPSRRSSFEITRQIRKLGRSQRNLSTSRLHVEEFDTDIESRDDTEYRFVPFVHEDTTGLQSNRDRTMSKDSCNHQTERQHVDSQRILQAIAQELPDLC